MFVCGFGLRIETQDPGRLGMNYYLDTQGPTTVPFCQLQNGYHINVLWVFPENVAYPIGLSVIAATCSFQYTGSLAVILRRPVAVITPQ